MTKVALVTGASSGIGESIAIHLAATGWTVYAVARRVERMAALESRGIHTFAMDVTDDASMVEGIDRIITEQGQIDALVNNAGYGSYGPVEHVPIDEARRQFEVNVFGLARLTQLVIPHMRTRRRGRIVNISSIGGKIYEPLGAWYHATKFAVEGFSDSLRIELAPFGIDVVIVEPGPIISEWNTIAREGMVEQSVGTVYEDLARRMAVMYERVDTPRMSSGPEVVAEKVLKALETVNPAARYPAGRGARAIVTARRLLPDRAMDAIMRRASAG
ncbi:oxidoreductase [Humibacillus xanthopallidus]|uniref:Short-subunit dehydrogenase n=1 Tax=Humibacillus xanthopallidus TaxID=412689 RepID=A0A543I2D0_9MICO|nr:oxidoreductase [Humibacillus xanthopallidus]TQM64754.1 short-subunit dehydrogenase [Humibacillus xanthopallidus]